MLNNKEIISLIESSYEKKEFLLDQKNLDLKITLQKKIYNLLKDLELGNIAVVEKKNNTWQINLWLKKAILLWFIVNDSQLIQGSTRNYFDKLLPRFYNANVQDLQSIHTRIVPPACIRTGAYLGKNTVIMPSYINVGAYIDDGSMIDIWSTIGSCARIGKKVHISAGVNIGGVLEPLQEHPTIIEDNCFIGAGSQIVEGIIVESNSVIASGVQISKSTRIYDRLKDLVSYGKIPSGSVVVPGSLPSENKKYNLNCAVIVKKVDHKTLDKTKINHILREIND